MAKFSFWRYRNALQCYAVIFICTVIVSIQTTVAHGMMTMQCPNGYYISKFSSAYDGNERFYKFGCSKFSSNLLTFDEECTTTETASTENGDMFMSCAADQYTVGIEIIEDIATGINSWQLLCCRSASIRIRAGDCIDTKFINDNRRSSTFSSSAQIIRRWQAMPENGDLRWWLQLCPVDIIVKKPKSTAEIRAKRQLPWEWTRGRFPASIQNYNPLFLEHIRREEERSRQLFERSRNSVGGAFDQNQVELSVPTADYLNHQNDEFHTPQATTFTPSRTMSTTVEMARSTPTRLVYHSRTHQYNERGTRTRIVTPPVPTTRPPPKPTSEKPLEALDYYDMYDENFDKKKHTEGGLLRGVSDFLQNIQDGLTLAQAAFPPEKNHHHGPSQNNDFHFRLAITPPTTRRVPPSLMFSDDEDNLQIGPFVQKWDRQNGPPPPIPTTTPSASTAPRREVNSIEGMLQMIGLCQGHAEL